jgi:hypothetical protein
MIAEYLQDVSELLDASLLGYGDEKDKGLRQR